MRNIISIILQAFSVLYLLLIPNYLSITIFCSGILLLFNSKYFNNYISEFKTAKDKSKYLIIPFVLIAAALNDVFNYNPEYVVYYRVLANIVLFVFSFQLCRAFITTLYLTPKNK